MEYFRAADESRFFPAGSCNKCEEFHRASSFEDLDFTPPKESYSTPYTV
jgi:hypothetical protein